MHFAGSWKPTAAVGALCKSLLGFRSNAIKKSGHVVGVLNNDMCALFIVVLACDTAQRLRILITFVGVSMKKRQMAAFFKTCNSPKKSF